MMMSRPTHLHIEVAETEITLVVLLVVFAKVVLVLVEPVVVAVVKH